MDTGDMVMEAGDLILDGCIQVFGALITAGEDPTMEDFIVHRITEGITTLITTMGMGTETTSPIIEEEETQIIQQELATIETDLIAVTEAEIVTLERFQRQKTGDKQDPDELKQHVPIEGFNLQQVQIQQHVQALGRHLDQLRDQLQDRHQDQLQDQLRDQLRDLHHQTEAGDLLEEEAAVDGAEEVNKAYT
jgi:hypothetical protein